MKVKICGITHPDDAAFAAQSGADYIGIIFTLFSKRKVELAVGKDIAETARQAGVEPIGVFAEETADQIITICRQTGIKKIQLHGAISKQALHCLIDHYSILYAVGVEKNGAITHTQVLPSSVIPIYDNASRGTGSFDWAAFAPPQNTQWILAGGLNPRNVAKAIEVLKPTGVDVSSGVEVPNLTRKDPFLMRAFIQMAKYRKENL